MIKTFVKSSYGNGGRCSIYEKVSGNNLERLNRLANIAKEDFPFLEERDIDVVLFGGTRIKGVFGIEFDLDFIPNGYELVSELEDTLS